MNLEPNFTLEQLQDYLQSKSEELNGYYTSDEWMYKLNVSKNKTLAILKTASRQGKLLYGKARRPTIDGREFPVAVYAFNFGDSRDGDLNN